MKKKINTDGADKFFQYVSKGVIMVPIIIVIIAILFRTPSSVKPKGAVNLTPPAFQSNTPSLKGPYICGYKDNNLDISVHMKDGKAVAAVKTKAGTNRYFFDGDCLHVNGIKQKCGLKSYVPLADNVFKGAMSGMVETTAEKYIKSDFDLSKFINSCKRVEFDGKVFKAK